MTAEEIERSLIAQGVPRDKARATALRAPLDGNPLAKAPEGVIEMRPCVALPITFTLPWSALVSDNDKYTPVYTTTGRPKMILTSKYREAKAATRRIAKEIVGDAETVAIPLSLRAHVWVPDNRPGHDVANFAKCCHDALESVIYTKDEWLHDVQWRRAGVDVDRPRAEITIALLG